MSYEVKKLNSRFLGTFLESWDQMNFSFLSFSFTDKANRNGSLSETKKKEVKHICMAKLKKRGKKHSNTNFQYHNYIKKTLWKHITSIAPKNKPKKTNKWRSDIFLLLKHKIQSNKKWTTSPSLTTLYQNNL